MMAIQEALTPALTHRNTFHWDRRQFAALSAGVQASLASGSLSNALATLTTNDYNKADLKHWLLWSGDDLSITEGLSSEQDPSPDAAGQIPGLRTWYNYPGKPSGEPELLGSNPQVACIARTLPDSTSQYSTYNYYAITAVPGYPPGAGFVCDNESSYSLPNGAVGELTNWFTYAANSVDLTSITNSFGQWVNLGYNTNHEVIALTNALNQVATLSWNPNLTGVQWPSGQSVSLSYGTADYGRLQTISWSPSGRSFTVNSYSNGLPSSITDDRGLSLTATWDGLNRLTGIGYPGGSTVSNLYYRLDAVATKDRLNNWALYDYDGLDHLVSATNANGAVTLYDWCGCGSLTAILDALTNLTTLNYDNQDNLTNITFPDYSSLTYQFDLAGRMTNVFDGAGRSLQVAYNNQGLPITVTGSSGALQQVIYDAVNRPISITDANGVTVTNTFDAINELLTRTWPDGIGEGFGYSTNGLIAYTNRDQKATHYGLDSAGRVTSLTNANQEVVQLGYDSLDDVISLVDGLNHTTTRQYNQYGWLTNKVDGLGRNAFQFTYNANGWVTNRWTPEKGNTGYAYDSVGNLTAILYPQSSILYSYDADNRLTNMVDAVGTTAFSYTGAGQLAGESNAWAGVTYAYAQQLRTAMSLNSQSSDLGYSYGYDSAWRLTDVVSPAGMFGYHYLSSIFNLPSSISLPNYATITNTYDPLARLKQTSFKNFWGHTLDGYTYTLDPLGLRTNIVRNLGLTNSSVAIGYDSIGQLTSWNAAEGSGTLRQNEQLGFSFDAADNLHSRTNGAMLQTFTVDAANELTNVTRTGTFTLSGAIPAPMTSATVNGQSAQTYGDFTFARTNLSLTNGQNTFTIIAQNVYGTNTTNILTVNLPQSVTLAFDNNGNLTNDGTRTFGYNTENQLTNVSVSGQWQSSFIYDGLGRRRIARDYAWSGTSWTLTNEVHYVYDGYLPIQERNANNAVLVTYTRGVDFSGDSWDAGGIGGLLGRTDTNGSTFYHGDANGNITALMDSSQNIAARYLYGPFGKLLGQWGPMASVNEMQFSSMPQHDGLMFYPFRAYEVNFQRWLNQDPIGEIGGINLYEFVGNNSLQYVDPLGLEGNPLSIYIPGVANGRWNSDPNGGGGSFYGVGLYRSLAIQQQEEAIQQEQAYLAYLNATLPDRGGIEDLSMDYAQTALALYGAGQVLDSGTALGNVSFKEMPAQTSNGACITLGAAWAPIWRLGDDR